MWDLKACTVCFSTDVKLHNIDQCSLRDEYNSVGGLKTSRENGMLRYLCVMCAANIKKFIKFRDKCKRANYAQWEMLKKNKQITLTHIKALNTSVIGNTPTLSYLDLKKARFSEQKFKWVKLNRLGITKTDIPVRLMSIDFNQETKNEYGGEDMELKTENIDTFLAPEKSIFDSSYIPPTNFDDDEDTYNDNEVNGNDYDTIVEESGVEQEYSAYGIIPCKTDANDDADGMNLEEEYATMVPISVKEARAAIEIYNTMSNGKFRCSVCSKGYNNEDRLQIHLRMHDKHTNGLFYCELCKYYYRTEFLLKNHTTEKHTYKYICSKCPEVNFDRSSAKHHFIWAHLQKESKSDSVCWYETRPSWLDKRGGKRDRGSKKTKLTASNNIRQVRLRGIRKVNKLPIDFPLYTPVSQEDQYRLVDERKTTKNYKDASFKCQLCYRGYREFTTYNNHLKKHDPDVSGNFQCDMCKLYFRSPRVLYKHMITTHIFKYSCQDCAFTCYNRNQAQLHYRWHKDFIYKCPHCDKEYKKSSTRLTHIRLKHPSCDICNICGHSFVSEMGLYCHKKRSHTAQEIDESENVVNRGSWHFCADCNVYFINEAAFQTHLGTSKKHTNINHSQQHQRHKESPSGAGGELRRRKPRSNDIVNNGTATSSVCEICNIPLSNDVVARRHYENEHPGVEYLKRYMCDVCGHKTKQYANLQVHMRKHTQEKPYACPHCDRRFSMPSNRDRHIVVHTGEKPYECEHCHRRFTQSSAVKLHIQTVHLKIPYAPWDRANRKRRRKEAEIRESIVQQQEQKIVVPPHEQYISAYITYND